ncbi:hypothetical protein ACK2R2_004155 [Yersinia enterocolitica]
MTPDEVEKKYPSSQFERESVSSRTKGSMGQTEITVYNIVNKESGKVVDTLTESETIALRGFKRTVHWE